MLELSFELQGGDKLRNLLDVTLDRIRDLTEPMQQALEVIKAHADENFSKKKSETEGTWNQLSSSTEKARANRWGYYKNSPSNPGILRWTGRLQNYVTMTPKKDQGEIKRNAPYASIHNIGGSKIPKRKFAELDAKTNAEIARIFQTRLHYNP